MRATEPGLPATKHIDEKENTMKQSRYAIFMLALATVAFICAVSLGAAAQDVTHPSTTKTTGTATHTVHQTSIKNAEVIHVSGHEIVVELENGKFELLNLPKDFRFHIDRKHLTVHELTPGTRLTQEIHTVSTPQEVTTLRTVNGKVWHVSGKHLILSFPDGENKRYTVPDGIVFNIEGQEKTVFDLRKGMEIAATVVTVAPQQLVSTHTVVAGQAPPPPNVPFEGPLLVEPVPTTPAPAVTAAVEEPSQKELPKTATQLPLVGLVGAICLALFLGMRIIRRVSA
jgi:hypothetical protein